jgi:hypothetical protein
MVYRTQGAPGRRVAWVDSESCHQRLRTTRFGKLIGFLDMNPKDARAVAALLRREHGPRAEEFCETMIRHFNHDGRTLISSLWQTIHDNLAASSGTPEAMPVSATHGSIADKTPGRITWMETRGRATRPPIAGITASAPAMAGANMGV